MSWLSGWDNRIECVISNTKVDVTLSNFLIILKVLAALEIENIDIGEI